MILRWSDGGAGIGNALDGSYSLECWRCSDAQRHCRGRNCQRIRTTKTYEAIR